MDKKLIDSMENVILLVNMYNRYNIICITGFAMNLPSTFLHALLFYYHQNPQM